MSDSGGTRLTIDNDLYPETPARPAVNPLAPYGYEQPNAGYQPPLPPGVNHRWFWQEDPERPYASGLPKLAEEAQRPTWGDVQHRLAEYAIGTAKDITQGIWNAGPGAIQKVVSGEVQPGTPEFNQLAAQSAMTVGMIGSAMPTPAGSLGMFGGRRAATAPLGSLQEAIAMERRWGASRDEIFNRTGWAKTPDGEWKFIIPDRGAKLRMENLEANNFTDYAGNPTTHVGVHIGKGSYNLEDILEHDYLYKAYPWARKIKVEAADPGKIRPGSEYTGGYTPSKNTLTLTMTDPEEMMRTILHEVQHAIQAREGFARGGTIDEFLKPGFRDDFAQLVDRLNALELKSTTPGGVTWRESREYTKGLKRHNKMADIINQASADYLRLGGEVESRATEAMWHQQRWDMPAWEAGEFSAGRGGTGFVKDYTPYKQQLIKKDPILLDTPTGPRVARQIILD